MKNYSFNFKNVQKAYMPVRLDDDRNTQLFLRTPNRTLLSRIDELEKTPEEEANADVVHQLFADVLSHNRTGYKVKAEDIDYDIADIYQFFKMYRDFISEACGQKN